MERARSTSYGACACALSAPWPARSSSCRLWATTGWVVRRPARPLSSADAGYQPGRPPPACWHGIELPPTRRRERTREAINTRASDPAATRCALRGRELHTHTARPVEYWIWAAEPIDRAHRDWSGHRAITPLADRPYGGAGRDTASSRPLGGALLPFGAGHEGRAHTSIMSCQLRHVLVHIIRSSSRAREPTHLEAPARTYSPTCMHVCVCCWYWRGTC